MGHNYLFGAVWHLLYGVLFALLYLALTGFVVWWIDPSNVKHYVIIFAGSFNLIVSGGLIAGTSLFVFLTQKSIPGLIENEFDKKALAATGFAKEKSNYFSVPRAIIFSANFAVIAAFIFIYCFTFPVSGIAQWFMIVYSCIEYALGVYVGRKLFYIAYMLSAISEVEIRTPILSDNKLNEILTYVNVLSTLTVVFVYVITRSFHDAPLILSPGLTPDAKIVLMLPAFVAVPVLVLFNFYPRVVMRRLLTRSIDLETAKLRERISREELSFTERASFVMSYDKLKKEELRSLLQLSLSDLPMGLTLLVAIAGLILKG
jgi:hypothetical protein